MSRETESNREEVLLPEDVAVLRGEMYAKIGEALSLGVFTQGEARQWKSGFEACTQASHMENLIDIIDDFVNSGLEVISQGEDLLNTDLLNQADKHYWQRHLEEVSFSEKNRIIRSLKSLISDIRKLKDNLIKILDNSAIETSDKDNFITDFKSQEVSQKEGIIKSAKKHQSQALERQREKSKQTKEPKKARLNAETATTEPVASPEQTQLQTRYQSIVNEFIASNRFQAARKFLDQRKQTFSSGQYKQLSLLIDTEEIKATQNYLQKAA